MRRVPATGSSLLLSLFFLSGCVTWQPAGDPRSVLEVQRPGTARITDDRGDRAVVENPTIREGWVVGTFEACRVDLGTGAACGEVTGPLVELDRVRLLEVQRRDGAKTGAAVAVGATLGLLAFTLIYSAQACADGATFFC